MKSGNMQKNLLDQIKWKQKSLENNKHIKEFFRTDLDIFQKKKID